MVPFSELLARHLDRIGWKPVEFARRVKVSKTTISEVLAGRQAPRPSRAEAWADALRLVGDERETFLDSMHLASSTTRIAALVERLEREAKRR